MVENVKENQIKVLRSGRGREFLSNKFKTFCENHGINKQLTTTHTPHQNGVAKRKTTQSWIGHEPWQLIVGC
jgi:transposase InsO family protein